MDSICNDGLPDAGKIRLMITDDHEIVRTGLRIILDGTDIEVVAEAANGVETLEVAKQVKPDIILLDRVMPGSDGLSTLEKLRHEVPECQVIMCSTDDNPGYVARAIELGASDYIMKGCSRDNVIAVITAVANGEAPSCSGEFHRIGAMKVRQALDDDDEMPLTQRETQVLRHVALGLSNKEIGRSLEISVETVQKHVKNILRKIDVSDRTEAAVWAVRRGLV